MKHTMRTAGPVAPELPSHGYPFIYRQADGLCQPDPIQQQAFAICMAFFDRHPKRSRKNP